MLQAQRKYVPDLRTMQRTCEVNYMALMRLLPGELVPGAERHYQAGDLFFRLEVLEESRFTTRVAFSQCNPDLPAWLQSQAEIRLYHDVRMAEVCAAQQISRLQPGYDYPNEGMHQPDEKAQVNQFLAEWLNFCLRHGSTLAKIF